MGDRMFDPRFGDLGVNRQRVTFSLTLNGSSDPTIDANASNFVASATYSATGKIAVVCSARDHYPEVMFARAEVEDTATPDYARASIGKFANEGTSSALSFQIATCDATGSATALSSRRVWVMLVLRNTASTP